MYVWSNHHMYMYMYMYVYIVHLGQYLSVNKYSHCVGNYVKLLLYCTWSSNLGTK